jgi:hypothetical protein
MLLILLFFSGVVDVLEASSSETSFLDKISFLEIAVIPAWR